MAFCIQYKPNPYQHYVLTGFVGFDESLYWFTSDLNRILGIFHRDYSSSVRVRHVAATLKDALLPSFLSQNESRKHVTSHESATKLLLASPLEAVQEFARKLDSPETYVRVLAEHDPADFQNLTQLMIVNEMTITDMLTLDLFFVWFTFFKKKAVDKLYKTHVDRTTEEEILLQQQQQPQSLQVAVVEPQQQQQQQQQPEPQSQQQQQQQPQPQNSVMSTTLVAKTVPMNYAKILRYNTEGYPTILLLTWKGTTKKFYCLESNEIIPRFIKVHI